MDIILQNQYSEKVDVSTYKGKKVLFFYPKANTSGWTSETKEFGEFYNEFKGLGVEIFGISRDSVEKQLKFATKLGTPFSLLSDVDGEVCEKLGVWQEKKTFGKVYMGIVRTTFLFDECNKII